MDNPTLVPIELIDANPYQPRGTEDPEVVAEIAESIKRNTMLQIPTARQVDGRYQLAFGHTRLAAYKLNGEPCMPLIIRELDNLQMFEFGVSENIKRRDLNPIEQAESMRRYMDEFKKNSVETGEFFNASPEKVRNTVRLLNLPAQLRDGVADGSITQNNARRLLTIQRVAPKEVKEVAKQLKENPLMDPDAIIADTLKDTGNSVQMWPSWRREEEPMAGAHLWPLRLPADKFPKDHLPDLTVNAAAKALGMDLTKGNGNEIRLKGWIQGLIGGEGTWYPTGAGIKKIEGDVKESMVEAGAPIDLLEKLEHLLNPPSCSACPFYAKANGDHYCTFKECYNRKAKAWTTNELEQAIETTGITQYDHKTDGKFIVLNSYTETHQKLVKDSSSDLRLKKGSSYNNFFDGVDIPDGFVIVAVGKAAEKLLKAQEQRQAARESNSDDYYKEQRRLRIIREANRAAMYDFLWNVATPALETLLNPITNLDFLKEFADRLVHGVPAEEPDKKTAKADRLNFYRRALLFSLLDDDDMWEIAQKKKPVSALAKILQSKATTWGVKLPKTWMDQASEADKAITVTTETEG